MQYISILALLKTIEAVRAGQTRTSFPPLINHYLNTHIQIHKEVLPLKLHIHMQNLYSSLAKNGLCISKLCVQSYTKLGVFINWNTNLLCNYQQTSILQSRFHLHSATSSATLFVYLLTREKKFLKKDIHFYMNTLETTVFVSLHLYIFYIHVIELRIGRKCHIAQIL